MYSLLFFFIRKIIFLPCQKSKLKFIELSQTRPLFCSCVENVEKKQAVFITNSNAGAF